VPLKLILVFALTEFMVSLTPGPAVLLIVSQGVTDGFKSSLRGILGIETGNAIFFVLSALGLGAVLAASANLYQVLKWLGACYLVFIGIRMLITKGDSGAATSGPARSQRSLRLFSTALITQLANPKAIVFYSAILPQFVSANRGVVTQFLLLGVVSIAVEVPVLMAYSWLAGRGGRLLPQRLLSLPERVAGVCLIAAGAGLASMRRP
jgi:homoserine/homoserine lactone efflux protein